MSWQYTQRKMIEELNTKIFDRDPVQLLKESYSSIDVRNTNYIMELKNREKYGPHDFDGSLIEKIKYDFLTTQSKVEGKIPGYVCRFNDGSYWAWNLDKVEKPVWYKKDLPESTHFGKIEFVPKDVGDLKLKDGKKLI